jgi:hypothetical protein
MPIDSLVTLEARIHESPDLNPQQKADLLQRLAELKAALADVSISPGAPMHGTTRVPDRAAPEGTRPDEPHHPVRVAMDDLSTSIKALEAAHPEFVTTVNTISTVLANMGI